MALLLAAASAGAAGNVNPAAAVQRAVVTAPLYVAGMLDSLSVGQEGAGRYVARAATIEGQRYDRSVVTEVEPRHADGVTTLRLLLGSGFDLLRATVGRDDGYVGQGAGGAYFEVWGDDRLLYKSGIMLSRKRAVRVGGSPLNVRLAPEEIEVSVTGVSVLRLVTRYAGDVPQRGANAGRARGCVWGDVRLMPRTDVAPLRAFDPVRDAVRSAAVQVTAAVAAAREADPGEAAPRLPLRVGIAPLRTEGEPVDETAVRSALLSLLASARQGGSAVFTALSPRDQGKLPGGFAAGDDPDAALTEAGRHAGADVVVAGSLTATADGRVELRAVDVRTGRRLATAVAALVFPGQAKNN
jgi:hypothetical protein